MDGIDETIIEEVSKRKLGLRELSKRLNIPASTIHNRIKKMEKTGIIRGYKADVDWKKLGFYVKAYVLVYVDTTALKKLKKDQRKIKEKINSFYFVEKCNIITGDADLIVEMKAKNNEELGYLLTNYIHSIEGIVKTKTLICID